MHIALARLRGQSVGGHARLKMGGEMRRGAVWRRYDGANFPILGMKPMVYLNHPLKTSIFRATVATLVFSKGLIGVTSTQSFSFPEGSDNPYQQMLPSQENGPKLKSYYDG
jgi:hypothetical protein